MATCTEKNREISYMLELSEKEARVLSSFLGNLPAFKRSSAENDLISIHSALESAGVRKICAAVNVDGRTIRVTYTP